MSQFPTVQGMLAYAIVAGHVMGEVQLIPSCRAQ
jgi:hypothetical protein